MSTAKKLTDRLSEVFPDDPLKGDFALFGYGVNSAMGNQTHAMQLKVINKAFTVCKVKDYSEVDLMSDFVFIGKTDGECSLVCETSKTPSDTLERNDGWRAFRIEGVLDFSLIGILAKISTCLAENDIGIFAISTFNTDYILTKAENFEKAIKTLETKGYTIAK